MSGALPTVLIVDDEPALLHMMSAYLERAGFHVLTYPGSDLAWEHVQPILDTVDVALLDLTVPGLSAIELGMRLLAGNPRLRVIVASGYPAELDELTAAAPGRVTFLHKPFTPKMLAKIVGP